jgi:hypothetical protein
MHTWQCLYAAVATERAILATARTACHLALAAAATARTSGEGPEQDTPNAERDKDDDSGAHAVDDEGAQDAALVEWLESTPECVSWARQCASFDRWRQDVLRSNQALRKTVSASSSLDHSHHMDNDRYVSATDFMEWLDEAAGGQRRPETIAAASLKQQAVRVAGDMGTAMQLLLEQAVVVAVDTAMGPTASSSSSPTSLWLEKSNGSSPAATSLPTASTTNTEVLQCVLEFFLDLCDDGELSSVAFFWPQLCHIHLRMLPPTNAQSLARVELVEDFLLTVATRYSIHLGLELVWSHTADLEESLQISSSSAVSATSHSERSLKPNSAVAPKDSAAEAASVSPACRRRRFAVVRFICELESLMFDFEGGWGGGAVSLGKMLSPSTHQIEQLKQAALHIQELRLKLNSPEISVDAASDNPGMAIPPYNRLSRSARFDLLSHSRASRLPEVQAQEKLRIAKNADYFSCHLNFSKRLADIAEKLRFMDLADRAACLEEELTLLNCSGTMGGDPLNRIRDHLIRVVRVPVTEGHVFRSKERTPVLLIMEVIDEMADAPPPPPCQPPPSPPPVHPLDNEDNKEGGQDSAMDNGDEKDVAMLNVDVERMDTVPSSPSTRRPSSPPLRMLEGALEGNRQSPGRKFSYY